MLNPASNKGKMLRSRVESFRDHVASLISDSAKREAVRSILSTDVKNKPGTIGYFLGGEDVRQYARRGGSHSADEAPNDIRQAESEALSNLITNIDIGDVRVNELNAYVIPNSNMVMRGGRYTANIVTAAIDTTQRPDVYVNGSKLANDRGLLELTAGAVGNHEYSGYIEVARGDGSLDRRPFSSSYTVIEPMATISPTMMNVLYLRVSTILSAYPCRVWL